MKIIIQGNSNEFEYLELTDMVYKLMQQEHDVKIDINGIKFDGKIT